MRLQEKQDEESWVVGRGEIKATYVEAEVVIEERPTSIDHFDVVQFVLVHRLKHGDLRLDSPKIQFGSLVWIHSVELCHGSVRWTARKSQ